MNDGPPRFAPGAMIFAIATATALSCQPVQGTSLSIAPPNACADHPCDAYTPGPHGKPVCSAGRCQLQGQPDYAFTMVISVPSESFFAPGSTFVVSSTDFFAGKLAARSACKPPSCLALPALSRAAGGYTVRAEAAVAVGLPLPDKTSLPVSVTFVPLAAAGTEMRAVGIPSDVTFAVVQAGDSGPAYEAPLPAGLYLRVSTPEAPYDQAFPPALDEIVVGDPGVRDDYMLGALASADPAGTHELDDPTGDSRRARVRRAEGLDGFRVWIADSKTGRRVSAARGLSGLDAEARLDTTGQSAGSSTALRDGLDVVLAPPDSWFAVPRLQSTLIGGQGLRDIEYPPLPAPVSFTGVVATAGAAGSLTGISGRLSLSSETIRLADGTSSPLLRYATTLATDDAGRFATVLPPGVYDVFLEPAEGTGFGKVKKVVDVSDALATKLEPPPRSQAAGRAVIADGRPLASATILALPSKSQPDPSVVPRPGRTTTDDQGRFRLELDQGSYDLTVVPEAGTGFPRVVTLRGIGAVQEDIGTLTVPAPTRLTFTIRAPATSEVPGLPIRRAFVRFFAEPPAGGPAVEVGNTLTDSNGTCEILLAQQPR